MRATRSRWAPLLVAATAVAGCGGGGGTVVTAGDLGLSPGGAAAVLASTTLYTSPDGGIYRNPDHLEVVTVARADVAALERRLDPRPSWAPLHALGRFTVVAIRLRNDGKAGSDAGLADFQVASDLAPDGTGGGPLRRFYHPMYTLAALAAQPLGADCSAHLDPGQSLVVVLVYPPLREAGAIVWGRYGDFALRAAYGSALPDLGGDLHAVTCATPPGPPP